LVFIDLGRLGVGRLGAMPYNADRLPGSVTVSFS
jgi:hypothetical protein